MSFDKYDRVFRADFSESQCSSESPNKPDECEDDYKQASFFVQDPEKMIWDLNELEQFESNMYVNVRPNIVYAIRAHQNMDFCKATCSLTKCHNETGNIWTHLVATMYFMYQIVLLSNIEASDTYSIFKNNDDMVLYMKLAALCPMSCFILSTIYHSYSCINKELTDLLYRIDLIGIGIKICGLCTVLVFGLFYSTRMLRSWISAVLLTLFILQFGIQLAPCYSHSKYDSYKTAFYVAMTGNNILVCLLWVFIIAEPEELTLVGPYLLNGGISIIIGFLFFYFQFPEVCFRKSRFIQLFCNSHMIWHIFVFFNGYFVYWGFYLFLKNAIIQHIEL